MNDPKAKAKKPDCLPGVNCDVSNCFYNEKCKCHADNIDVGPHHADDTSDTICATFKHGAQ